MIGVGAYHKFAVCGAKDAGDILVFCDLRRNQTLLLVLLKKHCNTDKVINRQFTKESNTD